MILFLRSQTQKSN